MAIRLVNTISTSTSTSHLLIHLLTLRPNNTRLWQNARQLKRLERLNPTLICIIDPRPAILPRLIIRPQRRPRLANTPIEETPRAPVEGVRVAPVFLAHGFPVGLLVLGPIDHAEVVLHVCP